VSRPRLGRLVLASLAWFGLFSLLYFAGAALGAWPEAPIGGFGGVDLAAGLAFGVVLLVVLVRSRRSQRRLDDGESRGGVG
jgi:hypothetical protein